VHVTIESNDIDYNQERRIGLALPIGGGFGWGSVGLQFAKFLVNQGMEPVLLMDMYGGTISGEDRALLEASLVNSARLATIEVNANGDVAGNNRVLVPHPVIHAVGMFNLDEQTGIKSLDSMGKLFSASSEGVFVGEKVNIGVIFTETTKWSLQDIINLSFFNTVYAGSNWGKESILKAELEVISGRYIAHRSANQ